MGNLYVSMHFDLAPRLIISSSQYYVILFIFSRTGGLETKVRFGTKVEFGVAETKVQLEWLSILVYLQITSTILATSCECASALKRQN